MDDRERHAQGMKVRREVLGAAVMIRSCHVSCLRLTRGVHLSVALPSFITLHSFHYIKVDVMNEIE